jgi:hypothetical protein
MSKDPFQILADELTLIRKDMDKLQRTSLDKKEAHALHEIVADGVEQMHQTGTQVQEAIDRRLLAVAAVVRDSSSEAAESAVRDLLDKNHAETLKAAKSLSQAAGEARREAWRWFGGFWVWLASVGALSALLAVLATVWITGRGDAREFGKYPRIYCSPAGGEDLSNTAGREGCMFWYD